MAWPCFMVEMHEHSANGWIFKHDGKLCTFYDLPVGAMFLDEGELTVKLPSGSEWNMDRGRIINAQGHHQGNPLPQWTRTGEPPNVTATPSINHQGCYHGWLRDGVLTDDCEGRKFP